MAVEGPGKALKAVNLDEPRAQVHLGCVGGGQEQRWYLDSEASNHMTGSKEAFSELKGGDLRARHHHLQVPERRAPRTNRCILHPVAAF